MSRFTDLFQEPALVPEPTPEPVKVEEVVAEKPVLKLEEVKNLKETQKPVKMGK